MKREDSGSSVGLAASSALGAIAAWLVARMLLPGSDALLALIAAWGVLFRLWQRSASDDPRRRIYWILAILFLIVALAITLARLSRAR